jgi:hypothetical protein
MFALLVSNDTSGLSLMPVRYRHIRQTARATHAPALLSEALPGDGPSRAAWNLFLDLAQGGSSVLVIGFGTAQ